MSTNQAAVLTALEFADKAKRQSRPPRGIARRSRITSKMPPKHRRNATFTSVSLTRVRTEAKAKSNQINLFSQQDNG